MTKYNIKEKVEKNATYRNLINPVIMDGLEKKIYEIICIQKKYLDKEYSAKKLAQDLGTNTRYISAVVNVRFGMNYTSLVNKYRIEEAKIVLADPKYRKMNMEDASSLVGFSNRQSFYASFYKITGLTPREYKLAKLESGETTSYLKHAKAKSRKK
ncbi:MAG: helix-turn-helix domain-containing protein [Prevotella sp.]|uniref:helix-turn-helix domain-containing protein n=1 Tax=Prevotella sp. TaxID=59823 RepID=UPI002A2ADCF2|nr:helix-turn-helix domain-containing protein [Prevotella sp.]MDD7318893.1 helix-turn-helix domain-containing protein [Prevotellaceae bacterium]MDY4019272.1 helix-turn-helix domain-containing protein [Prevotella sp.]